LFWHISHLKNSDCDSVFFLPEMFTLFRYVNIILVVSFCAGIETCRNINACVECTEEAFRCGWDHKEGKCGLRTSLHSDSVLVFDDTCPVDYGKSEFLADWMGSVMNIIGTSTLLDLSLPGTHDTLTYDLSTTVSEGGMDEALRLAELLHKATPVVPDFIEDYIRSGAQCQDLSITQQLDAGMRFLDIRMMLEYSDSPSEWYSLHMMQSRAPSLQYFAEIRRWMDAHPSEVVVMWLSKHGNECATGEDQYPKVSVEQKQSFWGEILSVFDGVTADMSQTLLNETSVGTMVKRNHRAVFYVADYLEMTGYAADTTPRYALDSCLIDNQLGTSGYTEAIQKQRDTYAGANARKAADKTEQRFYLVSLAGNMDYTHAALIKFSPFDVLADDAALTAKCAATFGLEGMDWCPETLLDGSQLSNYYAQVALGELVQKVQAGDFSSGLPNAIYINAVGSIEGTIRTGTEVLWGRNRSPDAAHAQQGYAYADTFVLYNVLKACAAADKSISSDCQKYSDLLKERIEANPVLLWDDAVYGRLSSW
jgi:hypothetical protein